MFLGCLPCCGVPLTCTSQQSGEIAGYPGSSVSFQDGGGTFATLGFFGVFGYWLGRGNPGPSQSVTFSFGAAKPKLVRVRVSALDSAANPERFNYIFSGADSVVFTPEFGDDFVDNGSSVTRAGTGSTSFKLEAKGLISSVFVEGEMVDGGSNGVIVEVCFPTVTNPNPLP